MPLPCQNELRAGACLAVLPLPHVPCFTLNFCLGIASASASALQALLLERGMLGFVVPLLLGYDTTHSDGSQQQQQGLHGLQQQEQQLPGPDKPAAILRLPLQRQNAQATKNLHAQLAVRALAALAGYPAPAAASASDGADGSSQAADAAAAGPPAVPHGEAAPACPAAQRALAALLTETLAPRLAQPDPLPLLRDLTSSLQTPLAIWNSGMRQELQEQLEAQRAAARAGEPVPAAAAASESAGEAVGFSYKARAIAGRLPLLHPCLPDLLHCCLHVARPLSALPAPTAQTSPNLPHTVHPTGLPPVSLCAVPAGRAAGGGGVCSGLHRAARLPAVRPSRLLQSPGYLHLPAAGGRHSIPSRPSSRRGSRRGISKRDCGRGPC